MYSYLSPKTEQKKSAIHGMALFARENISKNEIYAIKGGKIMNFDIVKNLEKDIAGTFLQIEDDFLIGDPEPKDLVGINHSCDPNGGFSGNIVGVAIRDIKAGEEITNDYAMFVSKPYMSFSCSCGSAECRKDITENDWKLKELQERYRGYFSPYIQKKIKN